MNNSFFSSEVSLDELKTRFRSAGGTGQELMNAAKYGAIDRSGDHLHRRQHVDRHKFLERLARLAVLDYKRVVEMLVERHLHVGRFRVLRLDVVVIRLAADFEIAGPARVDHVAEFAHLVFEVAVDQRGGHHVLFEQSTIGSNSLSPRPFSALWDVGLSF
jgi:hypothetical protein